MTARKTKIMAAKFSRPQEKFLLGLSAELDALQSDGLSAAAGNTTAGDLPTSATGLTAGMLWVNAGVVTVIGA